MSQTIRVICGCGKLVNLHTNETGGATTIKEVAGLCPDCDARKGDYNLKVAVPDVDDVFHPVVIKGGKTPKTRPEHDAARDAFHGQERGQRRERWTANKRG